MKKTEKKAIEVGTLIMGRFPDPATSDLVVGSVIECMNEGKEYKVEWVTKDGAVENVEKESNVRAGVFTMKVYREASGEFLPHMENK